MDKSVHRLIPRKSSFHRFTSLLSEDDLQYGEFSFNNDFHEFVPSTQLPSTQLNIEEDVDIIVIENIFVQEMNHEEQSPQHVDESFPQGNISPTHSE
ncbi:hypothetical protein KI387_008266, partial [Taxus chinensis]